MPRVSEKHREERRAVILRAAEQVFREKGYNAATIQDVIERSGISRGGIYTYFENMEQLFLELLQARDDHSLSSLADRLRQAKSAWPVLEELILKTAERIGRVSESMAPAIYEYYFTEGWRSKKHLPLLERRFAGTIDALTEVMQRGIRTGEFRTYVNPESIARTIVSKYEGLLLSVLHFGPEAVRLNEQVRLFTSYIHTVLTGEGKEQS